ncbi:hypothetical protein FB451DRAFT_29084 [Mycena latifolia]|nr:hypothetical protein FB451DRAFT_29084 [Mycena latifolia]
MSWTSPPAEALPPPVFFHNAVMIGGVRARADDNWDSAEDVVLPITPSSRIKYFNAPVVLSDTETAPLGSRACASTQCPSWSEWATAQFTFAYLFTLITVSLTPELFIQQHREQYMDAVFKLSLIIESIGKMADGSPPPSFFQSFYHLRRLFPNGLLAAEDFIGEVGTTLVVKVFALGIAVANQAVYEQRNLNMDWQDMCGIPDCYVDALETTAIATLNGDLYDLSQNRTMYLDWLGHLGYYAEFHHCRTPQTYLRSSANLIAFAHARAFVLPHEGGRSQVQPIHLPSLEQLSLLLCWGTGVKPFRPETIQYNPVESQSRTPSRALPPTAADILAVLAKECTSRLLYPLCVQATCSLSW